jgi:transposase
LGRTLVGASGAVHGGTYRDSPQSAIRRLYERLCAVGKAKKLALTACMRKLLTVLNAMARSNTPWRLLPMGTQDSC